MISSFMQSAINSILLMVCFNFAIKAYDYFRDKRYLPGIAKIKKQIKK